MDKSPTPPSPPSTPRGKDVYVIKEKDMYLLHSSSSSNSNNSNKLNEPPATVLRALFSLLVVLPAVALTMSHAHFLHEWKGEQVIYWLTQHPEIPITIALLYLGLVFGVPRFFAVWSRADAFTGFFNRSELFKCVLSAWNLFFSTFSCLGFFYSVPALISMVSSGHVMQGLAKKTNRVTGVIEPPPQDFYGSFLRSLCYWNASIFQDGMAAFWLLAFDLSKIVEMMDTVFLLLKGKKIVFLHWYHHLTVMLFCWHAHATYISNGLWFAVMNMGIHTVMYFYYFCFSCGLQKHVRPFASLITFLQIIQMVAGLVLQLCTLGYYLSLRREHARLGNGANCDTNFLSLLFGLLMYGSYFMLFIAFFKKAYVGRKSTSNEGSSSSSSSSSNSSRRMKDGFARVNHNSCSAAAARVGFPMSGIDSSLSPQQAQQQQAQRVVVVQEE